MWTIVMMIAGVCLSHGFIVQTWLQQIDVLLAVVTSNIIPDGSLSFSYTAFDKSLWLLVCLSIIFAC